MSPEANVKEKLTVTIAPPPGAADSKKGGAKKRTEAENLIDGHAATLKAGGLNAQQQAAADRSMGVKAGFLGLGIFLLAAFLVLVRYGMFLRGSALKEAYDSLVLQPWFFGLTTRLWGFRFYVVLAGVFLVLGLAVPRPFGRAWTRLGALMGMVMGPLFLGILYFVVLTPAALVMWIMGKDPLHRGKVDGTYWIDRRDKKREANHFEHPF